MRVSLVVIVALASNAAHSAPIPNPNPQPLLGWLNTPEVGTNIKL
ncbi:BQ5605_C028g10501 [Microbotryum silenes-dioicae]|uniref:BQ5605_C028g10501 protein n=1 Tax=Microbotryum silenes-dioicae TaxID=796604 RepID=A0A2X0MLA4_9BASI|nr:BQ5605_C028g10501 [Microbotryum silenes-dioicae]